MQIIAFLIFLFPSIVYSHAVGDVYRLPVPLYYYLIGAGLTVAVSFIALGLLMKRPKSSLQEKRIYVSWLPLIIKIGRILGVFFLALTIATGIFGTSFNFAPLFFWVYFLIGFGILSLFIGNIWKKLSPFKTISDWTGLGKIIKLRFSSQAIGVMLLLGLYWLELASGFGFDPLIIGMVLLVYSVISLIFSTLYSDWFQNGEVFCVLFGFIGKLAPFQIAENDAYIILERPWLKLNKEGSWAAIFVAGILLAGTSFDSVKESQLWFKLLISSNWSSELINSIGIILAPLPFIGSYLLAIGIIKAVVKTEISFSKLARIFVWSLIPIGFGYTLAHNFALLISSLPAMYGIISDPFGFGWNLFGTAILKGGGFVLKAKTVWFTEIAFIVLAHIVGIWLAHRIALLVFRDGRLALRSQYAMTLLMVGYTVLTLWLLSQPLVSTQELPAPSPVPIRMPPPEPAIPPAQL